VRGPGRWSNLVENMLTRFFEGPTPEKNKLDSFEKFLSNGKEEAVLPALYHAVRCVKFQAGKPLLSANSTQVT